MNTFKELKKQLKDIPGLVTERELHAIFDTVSYLKPAMAVEIGSLFGLSTSYIAEAMDGQGKLVCVEPFVVQGSDTEPYFKKNILPKYPIIELMQMDSSKAAHEFFKIIDFLFIDGDHQDDGIQRDCKFWLPKVRKGGMVCFHDWNNPLFPYVHMRVEEFTPYWQTLKQVDSLIIKIK